MPLNIDTVTIDIDQVKELYTELAKLVYSDMDKQYKEGKINGATYATTWATLMQSVVSGSMQTIAQLQLKETDMDRCVKQAQCDLTHAQTEEIAKKSSREQCVVTADCNLKNAQKARVDYETRTILPAQKALTVRQMEGFDDNLRQKLFEAQMNAWAMMFSSGLLETMPCFIASDEASQLYAGILNKTMPSYSKPSDAECCQKAGGTWTGGKCVMP